MMGLSPSCRTAVEVSIDTGSDISEECRAELVARSARTSANTGSAGNGRPSSSSTAKPARSDDMIIFAGMGAVFFLILGAVFVSRRNQRRAAKSSQRKQAMTAARAYAIFTKKAS
jgi:hypothetical protein